MNDLNRDQVEAIVENAIELTALKFSSVITVKLDEFAEKQKTEQRLSRENTFEQATGYSWDNRGHFKSVVSWAAGAKKNAATWRNAGIVAIITLAVKSFWNDITGG